MSKNTNNESVHSDLALSAIVDDIKQHLGLILVAEAGHGKSFTAFSIVKEALKNPNMTVTIMSPSTIWRRNYGAINCIKVGTSEFNPIQPHEETKLESVQFLRDTIHIDLDKKWSYIKSAWLENLLKSKQSLLFEIKYLNGRRIKAFESVVLQFIYEMQQKEIEGNPEYAHHYLIVLEEIQNSFGTYSMNSDDSLDLMTLFTQSRSDANIHYLGIGQRLNDISCKVVERLRPFIGLTLGENSLRKLKSMIPDDETKKRIQSLPKRHWIYLDGKTNPEIEIPEYRKEGKAIRLKPTVKPQPQQPQGLIQRFKNWQKKYNKAVSENKKRRLRRQRLAQRYNEDPSVYDYDPETEETGESDLEEDLALLNESDDLW
jgi:hypothetical protein